MVLDREPCAGVGAAAARASQQRGDVGAQPACPDLVDTLDESGVERVKAMSKKKRRPFTEEQKAEAVKIVKTSGKTVTQVAHEMGLTVSALRKWVKQDEINQNPTPRGPLTTDERTELARLRKELKRVEMERDFLKEAAAFFARET